MSTLASTAPVALTPPVELRLLGGVDLHGTPADPDAAARLLVQPKAVALLAYLAMSARAGGAARFQRRDRLVALLWPELDQGHARGALRKVIHAVRAALGPDAIVGRGDEEIALGEGAVTCDAVAFAADVDDGRLARALERYRGELLPGFHLPGCHDLLLWLDGERDELRERAAGAAWALARRLEASEQLTEAGQWARRAVRFAWDDERALRRALRLLAQMGDHAGALRLYDEFARRLRLDHDAEPAPETRALVDELRAL